MTAFLAPRPAIYDWLKDLADRTPVYFPQAVGESSFEYATVRRDSDLRLEDFSSPLPRAEFRAGSNPVPPGKHLTPARDELLLFRKDDSGKLQLLPVLDQSSRVLAGVRPCDLKAIHLMDAVNSSGVPDPHYLSRRSHTLIIAHDCLQPCDEHCFCDAAGSLRFRDGADVFLTPLDGETLLECRTEQGEALVAGRGFSPCADPEAKKAWAEEKRARPFGRQLGVDTTELPERLAAQWDSPLWDKHVQRCFSCGTCNLVCPTCYCFDVHDDIDLDQPGVGRRYRSWDGCMLPDFSDVAGGHRFRPEAAARQRHRVKRKFEYLPRQFEGLGSFCVGCGRCGQQCTVDIDIYDIVNDLIAESNERP